MVSLLLPVIYLAFISLGLPDALLGSAWPELYRELNVPLAYAGIITFIISCGTVISSLLSDRLTRRFGAGMVTAVSVLMTALALFGFSVAPGFWALCLFAVPYGLGAGGVDAALNNYVALHYSSRHMNWLHCFWSVGVSISPYVMSLCLLHQWGWQSGYRIVSVLQMLLTGILFCSLPLWKRRGVPTAEMENASAAPPAVGLKTALRIPGVPEVLLGFFCYCALESTAILWSCSYLALGRGYPGALAARWGALFFVGLLLGRFISGFISDRIGDRYMIRGGLGLVLCGVLLLFLPWDAPVLIGLGTMGLGCAPVYPAIIHETPGNFGAENSQAIIGIQMASAYVGATVMPPVFGWIAQRFSVTIFPFYLLLFLLPMALLLERLNRITSRER